MPAPAARPSAHQTKLDIRALFSQFPDLAEDEQLLLDTLEGETDLFELAGQLVMAVKQNEAHAEGLKGLVHQLEERKGRLEDRAEYLREILIRLLEEAGLPKLPLDIATVSLQHIKPQPIWPDQPGEDWPDEFVRIRREINKLAIKAALKDGNEIPPDIRLDNGRTGLAIRMR